MISMSGIAPAVRSWSPSALPLKLWPKARWWLLTGGSATGYAMLIAAMAILIAGNGGHGYDSYAYWLAGRNVVEGQPLYWQNAVDALGAYRYPPFFAQLWAPLTVLPPLAFSWAWRLGCLLCLRWLAGSWRNVGLWCLVPFTLTELSIANVTFPMAVTPPGRGGTDQELNRA